MNLVSQVLLLVAQEQHIMYSLINLSILAVYPPASATIAHGLDTSLLEITTEICFEGQLYTTKHYRRRTIPNDIECFQFKPVYKGLKLLGKFLLLIFLFLGSRFWEELS
jgi:hypothetical protein